MERKIDENQSKIGQKSILAGSRGVFASTWRPIPENEEGDPFLGTLLGPSWRPLGPSWRPLGAVLAVLAASWASKNPCKIRSKKWCILESILGMILMNFRRKHRSMLALKSNKNRCQLLKAIFWKTVFSRGKTMILRVQGIEVRGKNRWKIDLKMESRWEGILASIFNGFWWIFGGKLGGIMEPIWTQEGIEKAMEKWIASRWPKSGNKP